MSDERRLSFPIVHAFFVGGAGDQVTASNTVLRIQTSDGRVRYIMIDAGAAQGDEEFRNLEYPLLGEKIEASVLTHSHYDHVGDLAMLYKHGFRGKVYASGYAKELIHTMLLDGAAIADKKKMMVKRDEKMVDSLRKRLTKKRLNATTVRDKKQLDQVLSQLNESDYEPLYTFDDVEGVMELFGESHMFNEFEILDGIFLKFMPTTHQNGAIKVEVIVKDPNGETYTMFFSGDIGPNDSLMYKNKYRYENEPVDCVVMESLHGLSEPEETLYISIRRLHEILKRGLRQKKTVVLVGFSLDRNAMLVKLLNDYKRNAPDTEVIVDSPLTMVQLGNYQRAYAEGSIWFKDMGKDPFDVSRFKVLSQYKRHIEAVINGEGPRVVITASANGNGGRIVDYFEHGIQREDYVFVFCGWINPSSPSSLLHEAQIGDLVEVNGSRFKKRCKTYRLHGFTSHGYYPDFKANLDEFTGISTIILNHARAIDKLDIKDRLVEEGFGGDILIPKIYQAYELSKGTSRKLPPDECQLTFDEIFNIMHLPELADETEITREMLVEQDETEENAEDVTEEVASEE